MLWMDPVGGWTWLLLKVLDKIDHLRFEISFSQPEVVFLFVIFERERVLKVSRKNAVIWKSKWQAINCKAIGQLSLFGEFTVPKEI